MRNNPWFPLAVCLLCCGGLCLLIVTVGWGAIRTAFDATQPTVEAADNRLRMEISDLSGAVVAPEEAKEDPDAFRFPDDRAGLRRAPQLVGKLLRNP